MDLSYVASREVGRGLPSGLSSVAPRAKKEAKRIEVTTAEERPALRSYGASTASGERRRGGCLSAVASAKAEVACHEGSSERSGEVAEWSKAEDC